MIKVHFKTQTISKISLERDYQVLIIGEKCFSFVTFRYEFREDGARVHY
jgi:hypothetical protein